VADIVVGADGGEGEGEVRPEIIGLQEEAGTVEVEVGTVEGAVTVEEAGVEGVAAPVTVIVRVTAVAAMAMAMAGVVAGVATNLGGNSDATKTTFGYAMDVIVPPLQKLLKKRSITSFSSSFFLSQLCDCLTPAYRLVTFALLLRHFSHHCLVALCSLMTNPLAYFILSRSPNHVQTSISRDSVRLQYPMQYPFQAGLHHIHYRRFWATTACTSTYVRIILECQISIRNARTPPSRHHIAMRSRTTYNDIHPLSPDPIALRDETIIC
jgi:hypothetical protein